MNHALKIVAGLLIVLAVALGLLAYRLASKPAPAPAPAPAATNSATSAPPAAAATYPVVVAAKSLAAGASLTADAVKVAHWPVSPAQGFQDSASLVGQRLRFDLGPGEAVTQAMLMQGLATHLKTGERAVTIALDEISGAANRIAAGDLVDVFFTLGRTGSGDESEIAHTQSRLLLPAVRVLAYGEDSVDGPLSGSAAEAPDARSQARPGKASHAMLAVPLEEVNGLLLAVRSGKLQLALRSPEDAAMPDSALFAARTPLLQERKGLTAGQRAQLAQAENRAYAGNSLSDVSGAKSVKAAPRTPARAPSFSPPPRPRTVEVIRAGKTEKVPY